MDLQEQLSNLTAEHGLLAMLRELANVAEEQAATCYADGENDGSQQLRRVVLSLQTEADRLEADNALVAFLA